MSIIHNYGIFWDRSRINFGAKGPGNGGKLLGHKEKGTLATDFANQAGIYILYEGTDINLHRITYVGQVGKSGHKILSRLREHTKDHLWNRWNRFSWLGLYEVDEATNELICTQTKNIATSAALDQLEATLIQLMEPLLNKQGAKWHGAIEYFQSEP